MYEVFLDDILINKGITGVNFEGTFTLELTAIPIQCFIIIFHFFRPFKGGVKNDHKIKIGIKISPFNIFS